MSKIYIKSISLLWISSLAGAGATFLTQIMIARWLGAEDFGRFSSALAIVTILSPLAGFGVQSFWLKMFGEEGVGAQRWVESSLRFTLFTTFSVFVFLLGWAFVGGGKNKLDILSLLLAFHLFGIVVVELVSGRLQIEGRFAALACWQLAPHLVRLCLFAIVAVSLPFNILMAGSIYASVSFVFGAMGLLSLLGMKNGNLRLAQSSDRPEDFLCNKDATNILNVFQGAWPFGASALLYLIYFQVAIVLLNSLAGAEMAGVYNVAFLIMAAVYIFPSVVYQKFLLPKIFFWASHDKKKMYEVYRKGGRYMLALGLLALAGIWVLGPYVIVLMFGEEYVESGQVLQILAIGVPMRFLASTSSSVLTTAYMLRIKLSIMCAGAVIAVGVGLMAVPVWGVIGAAVVSVLVEGFLLVSFYYVANYLVFKKV